MPAWTIVGMPAPPRESDVSDVLSPKGHTRPSDRVIGQFAEAQHGVVTLAQLRELGLADRGIGHRAEAGRLRRVHRGVFAVERLRPEGRWLAAVLACGESAALSHASAAALWGVAADRDPIDVSVTRLRLRNRTGIVVHRAALASGDVTTRDGIACTTLERTLVDYAAVTGPRSLERAIERAEELRAFDLGAVRAQLTRMRGQRGTGALATALRAFDGPTATRSEAEERFLALIRTARLPRPEINAWLPLPEGGGYRPDFLWRDRKLIVEIDGRTFHARRSAFERDRRRDRRLAMAGLETRRYAAREVFADPVAVLAELKAFLTGEALN
jgi:very-short-patch-repair endonuclease